MTTLTTTPKNELPTHIVRAPKATLSKEARQCIGKYFVRAVQPGEAEPRQTSTWNRTTYRTGDGDHTAQVPRPGSLDAYSLPSRGNRT